MAASVVAGVVVLGLFVGLEQALTHDLLSADFTDDDDTFFTGEIADYRSEVRDGKYRLTAKTSSPPAPLETFGFFERTAYNVDIHAEIQAFDATRAMVGLECVHSVGGGEAGARYLFSASTGGEGYMLAFVSDSVINADVLATAPGPALQAGQRIGLRCNDGAVTGLIDDAPVIALSDPRYDSFKAVALTFGPDIQGDWIEFDHVIAIVPEH